MPSSTPIALVFVSLSVSVVAASLTARAQSFNVDVGDGASVPSPAYGGAAASAGVWQALDVTTTATALVDVDGAAQPVTLTASADLASEASVGQGPSGDDAALLDDYVALDAKPTTLTFEGLSAGTYQVYTYALAPGDPEAITYVAVGDDTQAVAGTWTGTFDVFITHALHEVELADGDALVISAVGVEHGALGGVQLVRLPDDPPPVGDPQGFNLDGGAQLGEPSSAYGAAAGQPGHWMALAFNFENPVTLVGLDGQATSVTLEANLPFGPAFYENPGPSGDDEKLLEDYLDLHTTPGTFELKGVPPGDYVIYTYAWGADDARWTTFVTIGEDSQTIGGAWPGALTQGVTHARHEVTVPPSGKLTIRTFGTKGTLNGIQIVPVPDDVPVEPGPESADEDAPESAEEVEPDADEGPVEEPPAEEPPEAVEDTSTGDTVSEDVTDVADADVVDADASDAADAVDADAVDASDAADAADTTSSAEPDGGARGKGDEGCGGAGASPEHALAIGLGLTLVVVVRRRRSAPGARASRG